MARCKPDDPAPKDRSTETVPILNGSASILQGGLSIARVQCPSRASPRWGSGERCEGAAPVPAVLVEVPGAPQERVDQEWSCRPPTRTHVVETAASPPAHRVVCPDQDA
jgi:hypothetical protein